MRVAAALIALFTVEGCASPSKHQNVPSTIKVEQSHGDRFGDSQYETVCLVRNGGTRPVSGVYLQIEYYNASHQLIDANHEGVRTRDTGRVLTLDI